MGHGCVVGWDGTWLCIGLGWDMVAYRAGMGYCCVSGWDGTWLCI